VCAGLQLSKNSVVQAEAAVVVALAALLPLVSAGAPLTADKAMERARSLETILICSE